MVMRLDASNVPQIWGLVAGDNSALTKPQFYSTLRLISLAQASSMRTPKHGQLIPLLI